MRKTRCFEVVFQKPDVSIEPSRINAEFDGPWDDNEKEPVFIYDPAPGVEDYEGLAME